MSLADGEPTGLGVGGPQLWSGVTAGVGDAGPRRCLSSSAKCDADEPKDPGASVEDAPESDRDGDGVESLCEQVDRGPAVPGGPPFR